MPAPIASHPVEPILLTVRQAAEALGLGESTIWKELQAGTWPVVRLGRSTRIARTDLEAWVEAQREDWATGDPAEPWHQQQPMARGR